MLIQLLKSKLHSARVTGAELTYEGSLGIDVELMKAVRLRPYEKILVANLENANRFETYAIPAPAGSGTICLNGAAAHLGKKGDRLIILAFASVEEKEAAKHRPMILVLDARNKPVGGLRRP